MNQKISGTWIIHTEDPFILMHPALSRFLYPIKPITDDLQTFLEGPSYSGSEKDICNFIKNGILEIIPNPTENVIEKCWVEHKKIVDIYIKIRESKLKSLGFIIYDH